MDKKHHIAIYTTASIPWLTGTSINPLFRAAYLAKYGEQKVTLVIPSLPLKDQEHVFPSGIKFNSHLEQEKCVRQWVEERTGFASNFSIRFYPGKVIRLSAATQDLPRSLVCNVHGVNPKFLQIGMKTIGKQQNDNQAFSKGVYYIGKMLWSKGYKELLRLLRDHQKELAGLEIDLYGSGEDSAQIEVSFKKLELAVRVHPARDHADPLFHNYKVLLNPSTTDVVCTTTAEALAMGKIVVCANHPSNEFFMQFQNCRTYDDGEGFVKATLLALSDEPAPLTDKQRHELSWEAATERFLKSAQLDVVPTKKISKTSSRSFLSTSLSLTRKFEDASASVHFMGTGFLSSQPDEEQCKELGLAIPSKKKGFSSGRWI
ncbi:digalactosyldiacylglycerol synthase 2, chloroplastic isoform X2 [Capsicum annuum]|uniref:digalactosyldiacylglycerol synthase 2, chloroplastic isoform X2 n=1 Tax=Capsicum annuum TaxID=4072 RepID=UPI0007BF29E7|nr:digalactosyldiacylglycerol synthase 2, chloroplastic isoform X2 [Capsicum annuum]XP_047253988.1 digalactosyldiacylglycerol synthase 2, chloroplastic isoform X2 [Capsicum annuum]